MAKQNDMLAKMPHIGFRNQGDPPGNEVWMIDLVTFKRLAAEIDSVAWSVWAGKPIQNVYVTFGENGFDLVFQVGDEVHKGEGKDAKPDAVDSDRIAGAPEKDAD